MYAEMSSKPAGSIFRLESGSAPCQLGVYSLSFAYHMFGHGVNELRVEDAAGRGESVRLRLVVGCRRRNCFFKRALLFPGPM